MLDDPRITKMERDGFMEAPTIVRYCEVCGEPIYEGDTYYEIRRAVYCTECIDEFKSIA